MNKLPENLPENIIEVATWDSDTNKFYKLTKFKSKKSEKVLSEEITDDEYYLLKAKEGYC